MTDISKELSIAEKALENPVKMAAAILMIYDDACQAMRKETTLDPKLVIEEIESLLGMPASFRLDN